jgi:hypothetical protein
MKQYVIQFLDRWDRRQTLSVEEGQTLVAVRYGSGYDKGDTLVFKGVVYNTWNGKTYLKFVGRSGCFLPENFRLEKDAPLAVLQYQAEKRKGQALNSACL